MERNKNLDEYIQRLKKELYQRLSQSMASGNDIVELQARLAIKKLSELERSIEASQGIFDLEDTNKLFDEAVDIVSKKNFYFNGEKLRAFDFSKE
jgi:hypothetical protein